MRSLTRFVTASSQLRAAADDLEPDAAAAREVGRGRGSCNLVYERL